MLQKKVWLWKYNLTFCPKSDKGLYLPKDPPGGVVTGEKVMWTGLLGVLPLWPDVGLLIIHLSYWILHCYTTGLLTSFPLCWSESRIPHSYPHWPCIDSLSKCLNLFPYLALNFITRRLDMFLFLFLMGSYLNCNWGIYNVLFLFLHKPCLSL